MWRLLCWHHKPFRVKKLCEHYRSGELQRRELDQLYERGKIKHTPVTITRYVNGFKGPASASGVREWKIEPLAYEKLTDDTLTARRDEDMLLGIEAELFMADTTIRLCRRKKGLTDKEITEWARAQISARLRRQYQGSLACNRVD